MKGAYSGGLTGGNEDIALAHDAAHERSPVAPPRGMGRYVSIEMTLPFILNVEREDMAREILPGRTTIDAIVAMFEDVTDPILKVRDAVRVRVPELHVVITGTSSGAIYCRKVIFVDIGIITPAAKLVTVMQSNHELNVYSASVLAGKGASYQRDEDGGPLPL